MMSEFDDLKDPLSPVLTRRTVATAIAGIGALAVLGVRGAVAETPPINNVVLVHGLFADGSCWTEVIPHLQAKGLNVTAVQNPLTTLPEAVASATRVLDRQDGPTVLGSVPINGVSFSSAC